jgi:hypothetical protein
MARLSGQHPDVGERIQVVRCLDEHASVFPGARGVIEFVDSNGTRHVRFDDGTQLGLVPGIDDWIAVDQTADADSGHEATRRRPQG